MMFCAARHRTGDDVHFDFQAHAAHAERFAHVFLAVDHEFLRQDVQDLLVGRNVDRTRGFDHPVDIQLRHFLVLDRHHAVRVEALDVAAGDAGVDLADLAVGHQLGFFQRTLNGVDGGFDIHHHAFFQAARWMAAHADDLQLALRQHFRDDGDNLRSADVEADDQFRVSLYLLMPAFLAPRLCGAAVLIGLTAATGTRTAKPLG